MIEIIIGIFIREIALGFFRIVTKKDIETEMERRGWFQDGLFHTLVRKLQPIKDIYREELQKARQNVIL